MCAGAACVLALVGSSCGSDGGRNEAWEGDAPFGTLPDGTPDNERVSPESFGPAQTIEWNTSIVRCLRGAGFNAELEGDGRFGMKVTDVPPEQAAAYEAATIACEEENPHTAPTELSEAEWQHLYEANLRHADCLRQHGLPVPDASSESSWIESRGDSWDPSASFEDVEESERVRLLTACPAPG